MELKLLSKDWVYTPPCNDSYEIIFFDDGNQQYISYSNIWGQFGQWRGKVALFNRENPEILIKSISKWKINKIN